MIHGHYASLDRSYPQRRLSKEYYSPTVSIPISDFVLHGLCVCADYFFSAICNSIGSSSVIYLNRLVVNCQRLTGTFCIQGSESAFRVGPVRVFR